MVTKQNIKTSRAPAPHIRSKHLRYSRIAGLILLALLVIFIGFKTYAHKQAIDKTAATQKAQFDEVDAQMKDVMNQIEATAGQPYELHYGHGCSHAAIKYAKGPLGCSIRYNFSYEIQSQKQGKVLAIQLLKPFLDTHKNYYTVPADLAAITDSMEYNYDVDGAPLSCALRYMFESAESYNNVLGLTYKKPVTSNYAANYIFECYGRASKPIYPSEG